MKFVKIGESSWVVPEKICGIGCSPDFKSPRVFTVESGEPWAAGDFPFKSKSIEDRQQAVLDLIKYLKEETDNDVVMLPTPPSLYGEDKW